MCDITSNIKYVLCLLCRKCYYSFFLNRRVRFNSNSDLSDVSSIASTSPRPPSPFPNWRIDYKPIPKNAQPKGIWDGYQSQDEFLTIHLR